MKNFKLVIKDWDGAQRYVKNNRVDWAMSFGNPRTFGPEHLPKKTLRLEFFDVLHDTPHEGKILTGPKNTHVEALIKFADMIDGGTVLVHCQAGISRSTAAALILMALKMGPGHEEASMSEVVRARSCASPNRTMVEIADKILNREGPLVRAVDEHIKADVMGDPSRLWMPDDG